MAPRNNSHEILDVHLTSFDLQPVSALLRRWKRSHVQEGEARRFDSRAFPSFLMARLCRVPFFLDPKVDLKPGVVDFPKRETPGLKSTSG